MLCILHVIFRFAKLSVGIIRYDNYNLPQDVNVTKHANKWNTFVSGIVFNEIVILQNTKYIRK